MRAVVVGASSGLGRCLAVGLARGGASVAMLARRADRLERAASEAGGAVAVPCDVTSEASVAEAVARAADRLGGIDALVYTPGVGPLAALVDTDAETWRRVFDTNVIGAALVTAAALPHLRATAGHAVYLSSVSASGQPWPGLGAYAVSKAALEKLVDAWRGEHPEVGFTRITLGDCAGGSGDAATGFVDDWDPDLAARMMATWVARGYMDGSLIDVEDLVEAVRSLLQSGPSLSPASVVLAPRPQAGQPSGPTR